MLRLLKTDELKRATWECVHFVSSSDITETIDQLERSDIRVHSADVGDVASDDGFFAVLGETLRFPEYFGANWDAVDECLRTLESASAGGLVLVLTQAERLWRRTPKTAGQFVECWLAAAEHWGGQDSERPVPFHLLFVW